jgi:hypothetical protein
VAVARSRTALVELLLAFVLDVHIPIDTEGGTIEVRAPSLPDLSVALRLEPFRAEDVPALDARLREIVIGWGAKRTSLEQGADAQDPIPVYRTLVEARFECPMRWRKMRFIDGRAIAEPTIVERHRFRPVPTALEAVRTVWQIAAAELHLFGHLDPSLRNIAGSFAQAVLVGGNPYGRIEHSIPRTMWSAADDVVCKR